VETGNNHLVPVEENLVMTNFFKVALKCNGLSNVSPMTRCSPMQKQGYLGQGYLGRLSSMLLFNGDEQFDK